MSSRKSISCLSPRVWLVFVILFAIGTPFYWHPDDSRLVFGLPVWVVVTLTTTFLAACLAAWMFLNHWPEGEEPTDKTE